LIAASACATNTGDSGEHASSNASSIVGSENDEASIVLPDWAGPLARVSELLRCESVLFVYDSTQFYDRSIGLRCTSSGRPECNALAEIYETEESVAQVLSDYEGGGLRGRQVVLGRNWYVMAEPECMGDLPGSDIALNGPTATLPSAKPLEPRAQEMTDCMRFVSGSVYEKLTSPEQDTSASAELERIYPAIGEVVDAVVAAAGLWNFADDGEVGSPQYESAYSREVEGIREYCEETISESYS
jgi:hypothetical protein